MSTDTPYAWGNRPPFDDNQADMFDDVCGDAIHDARSLIANDLPELLWDIAKEAVAEQSVPTGWEDWYEDNKDEMATSIYDELLLEASKLWES